MRGAEIGKTKLSRHLRRRTTIAERVLWNRLRSRALCGLKFVRQEPVGPYIVDLVCREERLVIEVDGGHHAESSRDAIRDRWLRNHGYRVLRFWNNDVIANTGGVVEAIADSLQKPRPPQPVNRVGEDRPLPTPGAG
jgi:very-short-patch-repair endonuclease